MGRMLLEGLVASLLAVSRAVSLLTEAICGPNSDFFFSPTWDLQLQQKALVRDVMTVKTLLCGGSLGQDPAVLPGSPDTSLSS